MVLLKHNIMLEIINTYNISFENVIIQLRISNKNNIYYSICKRTVKYIYIL